MEWKHQREHHNRQDKAKKPNYREKFLPESLAKASPFHLARFKEALVLKQEILLRYRAATYLFDGRRLKLDWNLKTYAQANKLETLVNRRFKPHRAAALRDLEAIRLAISDADLFWTITSKREQQLWLVISPAVICSVYPLVLEDDGIEPQTLRGRPSP